MLYLYIQLTTDSIKRLAHFLALRLIQRCVPFPIVMDTSINGSLQIDLYIYWLITLVELYH
jgi:hypothetical protein